ncbi:MAG: hypothetical protein C0524_08890 [Rhodobacter sp.]|nr:hypothetical protein [Rhodobacter sp.]
MNLASAGEDVDKVRKDRGKASGQKPRVHESLHTVAYGLAGAPDLAHTPAHVRRMGGRDGKSRLGRNDWVLAGLRVLVQGGLAAVKAEAPARDIGATKGSFYWHFKGLSELRHMMLDLWEEVATRAITQTVQTWGLDGRGRLILLADMVPILLGGAFGGVALEPALRDWGRTEPRARAVPERVDRQRLDDLAGFLRAAGVLETEVAANAQPICAGVIGLESLHLTTGAEMRPAMRALVENLLENTTG